MSTNTRPEQAIPFIPEVPRSVTTATREELTDVELEIEGALPADLVGHVLMLAPCGSLDSGGLPSPGETTVLNGDGMMFRFDFDPAGQAVRVTSRIAKSADYWADVGSHDDPRYRDMRFRDAGMVRLSLAFGLRNELNTAWLPFPGEGGERVLVTFDAGRPHEIDASTLETITPVGYDAEWVPETLAELPFPPNLACAHPAWDAHTSEMFIVNFQRSIPNFLSAIPFVNAIEQLPGVVERALHELAETIEAGGLLARAIEGIDRRARAVLEALEIIPSATYLVRWDGAGPLERFRLVQSDGTPVVITQTAHQVHVTRDYVVLVNTAVKIGPDQAFNNPLPGSPAVERLLRAVTTRPEASETDVYFVPRSALMSGQRPLYGESERRVVCQRATIPVETDHFLADYDNPGDVVTVYLAQSAAADVGEWVRSYDQNYFTKEDADPALVGQLAVGAMDIHRFGQYRIHATTGQVRGARVMAEDPFTWGLTFYAGKDLPPTGAPAGTLTDIYWNSAGFYGQLLTQWVWDLYEAYPHRLWRTQNIEQLPGGGGRPATLFRVHTPTMSIADSYVFEPGHMVSSPQFVPKGGSKGPGGSTDGYLFCTVYTPERNEIWIFDAADLSRVVCKMHHPRFDVTLTLHTAWLETVTPRTADYYVDPRRDYGPKIAHDPELERFFEEHVYPNLARPPRP